MRNVNETDLLESRELRDSVMDRVHVLDKIKALSLLSDGVHMTTQLVANYFEVGEAIIRQLVHRHRSELTSNGMRVVRGADLREFESDNMSLSTESRQARRSLMLYPRRAVLNIAMLLRDSNVARQVRTYLLDTEEANRRPQPTPPVDNFIHSFIEWINARIAEEVWRRSAHADEARTVEIAQEVVREVISKAVTPLLNTSVQGHGELLRRVIAVETEQERLKRVLREREAAAAMGAVDAMNSHQFENHIAWLCRRDGCTDVVVTGGHGDTGADVVGYTPSGLRLVVQCKHRHPGQSITSGDVQQFIGMAKLDYHADVALYVATCRFTRDALILASRHEVTAVHRVLLHAWTSGAKLEALR
jgi:restriction system protein